MRVELLTDPADLDGIVPAWWDLFSRVPDLPPFMTPAWLMPWWQVFGPGNLMSVAVWDGDRLAALAPLYRETRPHGRRLLPLGIGLSDSLDVLLDPAVASQAGAALSDAIAAGRDAWDQWSAEEARSGAAVLALPEPPGCRSRIAQQSASPVLALPGRDGTLEAAIPAGKRRKWRMAQNRVGRRDWSMRDATADTLDADLGHLFRLHGERWQSRGEAGVLADATVDRFHRAAAPRLLAAGLLVLTTLTIDGTVAGAYYGLRGPQAAYAYLGGFDPAFGFESPGTLLVGAAIEAAWRAGATQFHFLRGQEGYKYEWGAQDSWTARRLVEPRRR